MDTLVTLCKRRGIVFPSSEIYGGYAGFFDYGPLGVEIKNNIKQAWWQDMVHRREDVVGLDSSIIMHPGIWKASGHVDGFSDPMVDCRETKKRYRADTLMAAEVRLNSEGAGFVTLPEGSEDREWIRRAKLLRDLLGDKEARIDEDTLLQQTPFTDIPEEIQATALAPEASRPGTLTAPRHFNLMFHTFVGPTATQEDIAYLRPETAQGIFANYKNILDTGRVKLPFGIAQIGKAFRNEITPRNFVFRSREFEQMEIEYFIAPDADWQSLHREWIDNCLNWFVSVGIPRSSLSEDVHPQEKLAHYSQATTDLMFRFPHGVQELVGIAARGDFDLSAHQKHSGRSMEYFDENSKMKFVPHVIEPSFGVDRTFLALLTAAYCEDEVPNDKGVPEKRSFLRFHPRIAPYKAAVLPLVKNKEALVEKAREIHRSLQRHWNVFWDASGAIGRRYRRMDEIGTPYCITVDFDTIEKDGCVTIRDRDSTKQERLHSDALVGWLREKLAP